MEEILASIRRIIADDQPLAGSPAPASPPHASRAALPPPGLPTADTPPADLPPADLPMASETAHAATEPAVADLPLEAGTVAAPQFVSPEGTAGFADTPHPLAPQPPEAASAREPEPAPVPGNELATAEPDLHEAALRAMHEEMDVRAAVHALHEDTLYEAVAEEPPMSSREPNMSSREPPVSARDVPEQPSTAGLFSAATSQSLAAAFNTLAISRLAADSQELRGLAREMLQPLLKDWLDENLPSLVEAIIREEIDQMARRTR